MNTIRRAVFGTATFHLNRHVFSLEFLEFADHRRGWAPRAPGRHDGDCGASMDARKASYAFAQQQRLLLENTRLGDEDELDSVRDLGHGHFACARMGRSLASLRNTFPSHASMVPITGRLSIGQHERHVARDRKSTR